MGFVLKIDQGGNSIATLGVDHIEDVQFRTDIPYDSDARSTDLGVTLDIQGKIITAVDGEEADDTAMLALWALEPAEIKSAYANVVLEVISESKVVREITFKNAYVVGYEENYGDDEGTGTFKLLIKQKKDKTNAVTFKGDFQAE